ncbi:MAG TPA: DUF4160 domain-containing protein [Longimicrobium sp.]
MVRVLEDGGFIVHIWPNDHEPAHVHVYRAEGLAIIEVKSLRVRAAYDMKPKDVRRAIDLVSANQILLFRRWKEIHGN